MIEYDRSLEGADVQCDHCSHSEFIDGDFQDVVTDMKDDGWKITFEDCEYNHKCPSCVADDEDIDEFL